MMQHEISVNQWMKMNGHEWVNADDWNADEWFQVEAKFRVFTLASLIVDAMTYNSIDQRTIN